jgi:hypothetical protein
MLTRYDSGDKRLAPDHHDVGPSQTTGASRRNVGSIRTVLVIVLFYVLAGLSIQTDRNEDMHFVPRSSGKDFEMMMMTATTVRGQKKF